jgi:hypothetical protein
MRTAFCVVMVLGIAVSPVFAQSFLSSLESVIGPVVPSCGLSSTFRSEVGTALSIMSLDKAELSDGRLPAGFSSVPLHHFANLDESPLRFDTYVNFRFWRIGARAQWSQFEDKSLRSWDFGKYTFNTIKLGADFDVIQHSWLVVGASADFYLNSPEYHGNIFDLVSATPDFKVDLTGKKPATIGAYARYIPPEIINIPVHAEFYANFPLYGSQLTEYGGALVFRPQIYRFDVAIKGLLEKSYLKVLGNEDIPNPVTPNTAYPPYKLDTKWFRYGVELAVYF